VSSAPSNRFVSIQYLRALAAILVAVQHANTGPIQLDVIKPDLAKFGVDLFFVISGYIMWATTAATARTPGQFWVARIIRIVPLYWAFTSLYLAIVLLHPAALQNPSTDLVHILKSYAFVPAIHPALGNVSPLYSLGWTLNYEMFFYLVFGIALLLQSKVSRLTAVTVALGGLVALGFAWRPTGPIMQTFTSELLLEFLCGTLIAAAGERLMSLGARGAGPMLGIAALWLLAAYTGKLNAGHFLTFGLPAALAVAGLLAMERTLRTRPLSAGLLVGDASYSLYLCHPFMERAAYSALPTTTAADHPVVGLLCVAAACLAATLCAVAVYRVIEQPTLALLRQGARFRAAKVLVAPQTN
jgi:exopolysaccharide production protein ExoZ